MRQTLLPDLGLDAHGASSGVGITVEHGRLVAVGPATNGERLPGRAIVHVHITHAAMRDAPDWCHLAYHLGGDRFAARIKLGRVL